MRSPDLAGHVPLGDDIPVVRSADFSGGHRTVNVKGKGVLRRDITPYRVPLARRGPSFVVKRVVVL